MSDDEIRAQAKRIERYLEIASEAIHGAAMPAATSQPPLVLRDDGKSGCGLRMSHRDGETYLDWSYDIMYGPASANLDMN